MCTWIKLTASPPVLLLKEKREKKKRKKKREKKKRKEKTHRVLPRPPPEGGKRRDASVALVLDLEVEFKMQNLILIRIFRNSSHQYRFRYTNI